MAVGMYLLFLKKSGVIKIKKKRNVCFRLLTYTVGRVDALVSEKTDLILTNEELTRKVKELEKRIRKLENKTTKLENLFYKNGISQEELEKAIQENEKKDCSIQGLIFIVAEESVQNES